MKTGLFITARLGSTRLKRKHLLPVNGQPIMLYLIKRITEGFKQEIGTGTVQVIIVTADEPENREFESMASGEATLFYGSVHNIPLRHLQAVRAYGLDTVVSVDGDDILCSVRGMKTVHRELEGGGEYVKTSGLPFGMNSFGYSGAFLASALSSSAGNVLETGWGRIFDETKLTDIPMVLPHTSDLLRFTLDYEEDYRFFEAVIKEFGEAVFTAGDEEIVNSVVTKGFYRLNEVISKEYWENFYRNLRNESGG